MIEKTINLTTKVSTEEICEIIQEEETIINYESGDGKGLFFLEETKYILILLDLQYKVF